jgi:hypothetical protein
MDEYDDYDDHRTVFALKQFRDMSLRASPETRRLLRERVWFRQRSAVNAAVTSLRYATDAMAAFNDAWRAGLQQLSAEDRERLREWIRSRRPTCRARARGVTTSRE